MSHITKTNHKLHIASTCTERGQVEYRLPPHLLGQFEKDRQKKAERKKERKLKRLERDADPFSQKKGGKRDQKAMFAATDPTITALHNRVINLTTLVHLIRQFVNNLGGPASMELPPADKSMRQKLHRIANAFNLKSVSSGKEGARYTTLTKTSRTGVRVDERTIARIVGDGGNSFLNHNSRSEKGKGVGRASRHREGDVVGNAAPKLNESNVGFRLLELMGWSEGDRIGASTNGLEAPLAAVIKTSKLGLGALRKK